MFSADDILARTRKQPFQPFRILTTTGKTYDVHHPDQALATRRSVSLPINMSAEGVPDQAVSVAIVHIVEIEDLAPATPPAGTNGSAEG